MIDKNDPRLTDFVLGELSAAEGSEIQAEIEKSPELASVVEEIRQTVGLLGAAYLAEEPLSLLDEQKAELAMAGRVNNVGTASNANLGTVPVGSKKSNTPPIQNGWRWWSIALAASLLGLMLGGAAYMSNLPTNPEVASRWDQANDMSRDELKRLQREQDEQGSEGSVELAASKQKFGVAAEGAGPRNEESLLLEHSPRESGFFHPMADEEAGGEAGRGEQGGDDLVDRDRSRKQILNLHDNIGQSKDDQPAELFFKTEESPGVLTGRKGFQQDQNLKQGSAGIEVSEAEVSLAEMEANLSDEMAKDSVGGVGLGGSGGGLGGGGGGLGGSGGGLGGGGLGGSGGVGGRDLGRDGMQGALPGNRVPSPAGRVESAPAEGSVDKFSFSRPQTTESANAANLDMIRDGAEEEKRQPQFGAGRSRGGGGQSSSTEGIEIPSTRLDVKERNVPMETDQVLKTPALIVPDASSESNSAPKKVASPEPQPGVEPAASSAAVKPSSNAGESRRFSGTVLSKGTRGRDVAGQGSGEKSVSGKELSPTKSGEERAWYRYEALGIKVEDRIVDELRSQNRPVERTRTEERTRRIKLADGSFKTEKYELQVPVVEQQTEGSTVQVPRRVLTLEPDKSKLLVEKLARRVDPNRKREFQLDELFDDSIRSYGENKSDNAGLENAEGKELQIAEKLLGELKNKENREKSIDASGLIEQLGKSLARRNAEVRRSRTWKRVKAIPNTTRLMLGDKDELDLTGMQANVQVDGFRARVLIDCFYYNDRGRPLEGNFKLRLPDDASLYYFAFGESAYDFEAKGKLAKEEFLGDDNEFVSLGANEIRKAREDVWAKVKEAKMVPREKAAHAFRETVRRKVDPALVEWSGAGVFNARVFPLAPNKLHRIVIGYDVNLKKSNGDLVYEFDVPEQVGECRVDLDVLPIDGVEYRIEPAADPFEKQVDGVTQRKYRFEGPQENGIRLTATKSPEVLLQTSHDREGEFWGVQITPDLPVEQVAGSEQAIFLLDTSLSSNPDKFNVWLDLLESTLANNRDSLKKFAVVFFNVEGQFWKAQYTDNTEANAAELIATCQSLSLEGATDLYAALEKITGANWVYGSPTEQDSQPTSGPDLFLLSDGAANWGETDFRMISRQLSDHQLGSLFAYQTGFTGTAISELRFLAGQSGGAVFSVVDEDEIKTASTAHRNRPWKLDTIRVAGATDVMTAGRVQWVYPGQTITVVGRGKVNDQLELDLVQATETRTLSISPTRVQSELASRLYGQIAVGQLESLGAKVFDVAASYARHFRVTGDTCSLLMLESEAEYQRFGIKPQEDLFVIKAMAANELIADTLRKSASELGDPKAQLVAWLERLETMPGLEFKMPPAFKLALEKIQISPISDPLDCRLTRRTELSRDYLAAIRNEQLDYALIANEADRRAATSVDDAIKVFSSLVERNPGDLVVARDIAFTAMELGRPAPAYHLFKRIAKSRPFEGSVYPAMGQCLAQLGQADMAIVYYEIALGGTFQRQGSEFKQIVSAEYMHLLRRIESGDLDSSVKDYASARSETLSKNLKFESADLLITMMWNTDQSDVDLHVIEPSGEECSYENRKTLSGGQITSDITTGFGPEMYFNQIAPKGKYDIQVSYFGNDQNRTELRNKVYLTIYRGFGTANERLTRKTVLLNKVGEQETVATVGVKK